jgi:hypothetical protein
MSDEEWPAMFAKRHVKDTEMNPARLVALWNGTDNDEYGIASVIGTAAIALKMMGRASTMEEAEEMAKKMWEARTKEKYNIAA